MDNNGSQSRPRVPNFIWTDDLVRILVDVIIEHQKKNGSRQSYNWKEIGATFGRVSGKTTTAKDVCRNKYESMKKEYKAWHLLRNAETGLGWDPNTRKITASEEWWDRKMKEDSNCKKFKNKGMDAEYEELLNRLFVGNVATGRLATAAGMDPPKSPQQEVRLDDDLNYEQGDEDNFFRDFIGSVHDDGTSGNSYGGVRVDLTDYQVEEEVAAVTPTPQTGVTTDKVQKKRRRQSVGSSRFEEHLAHTRANSDKIVALFQEEVSSRDKERDAPVIKSLDIIAEMVEQGSLTDGSPLWCFAVSLNKSKKDMSIFMNLATNAQRANWLKWEFEKSERSSNNV